MRYYIEGFGSIGKWNNNFLVRIPRTFIHIFDDREGKGSIDFPLLFVVIKCRLIKLVDQLRLCHAFELICNNGSSNRKRTDDLKFKVFEVVGRFIA